ncbi:MAG: DUF6794 domain-containing protein, partial [bacterium]
DNSLEFGYQQRAKLYGLLNLNRGYNTMPGEILKEANDEKFIPKDLDEAITYLMHYLDGQEIKDIEEGKVDIPTMGHHGYGTSLRNEWGLWKDSVLARWFKDRGIWHADDMSGIILESLKRTIKCQPRDLVGQIQKYLDYWEKLNSKG